MTTTERNQIAFYKRTGLSLMGISYAKAMQNPALRIAIECGAKANTKGNPAPVQPALI